MIKKKFIFLIFTLCFQAILFATDNKILETDDYVLNPWIPKFAFENSSEFMYDIDITTPGFLNTSKIFIKFEPFNKNNIEIGKGAPLSGYIKIKDFEIKTGKIGSGEKLNSFKMSIKDIVAQVNMYDFYIKLSLSPKFNYHNKSVYSAVSMTKIESKYYGIPGDEKVTQHGILRSPEITGGLAFGYNIIPLKLEIAIGGIGTGNRNHLENPKNQDDPEKPFKFNHEKGILAGLSVTWKPINNDLTMIPVSIETIETEIKNDVIPQSPIEISFGFTSGFGNNVFNNTSMCYFTTYNNEDLFRETMTNASIISSLGFKYKLGLKKVNNKNTYLIFQTGVDLGIDPFASDFSSFGYISKKANTINEKLDKNSNNMNFNQDRNLSFSYSAGSSISYAWNKDDGKEESWEIDGKDTYDKTIFKEQDKKSGITLGLNYSQSLYNPKDNTKKLKEIAKQSFKSLNLVLSTYEDNKEGIIPGLGWIASIGVYDLLRKIPKGDPINDHNVLINPDYVYALKIGTAIFLDYALQISSISSESYITPYIATHVLGVPNLSKENFNVYLKAGLKLEKLIRLTTFIFGWDSNNLLGKTDKFGSVFIKVNIDINT